MIKKDHELAQTSVNLKGLAGLSPISRETAQDMVYGQLRQTLICGGFDAGEVFKPSEIAHLMSVSSMPVREALARLVSERALESMMNRRVRVPLLDKTRMRAISQARHLIEGELASCAFDNLTAEDVEQLQHLTHEYEAATNETEVALANHAFHFVIYERSASPVLIPFAESLWMQAGPYTRVASRLFDAPPNASATRYHHDMMTALHNGDRAGFIDALRHDITQSFSVLEQTQASIWETRTHD